MSKKQFEFEYRVGDRVLLCDKSVKTEVDFCEGMTKFCNAVVTISSVDSDGNFQCKEDSSQFIFSMDMIVRRIEDGQEIRKFTTGATRNIDTGKLDYEGFTSPEVDYRFAVYMHGHRKQKDGTLRTADNWQRGIPEDVYMKSLVRHVKDLRRLFRGGKPIDPDTGKVCDKQDLLCATIFNANGLLFEDLKED